MKSLGLVVSIRVFSRGRILLPSAFQERREDRRIDGAYQGTAIDRLREHRGLAHILQAAAEQALATVFG